MRPVECEGCGATGNPAGGCELPSAWGFVEVSKCWEGYDTPARTHGQVYRYARKLMCAGCLYDMREAYRARRELTAAQKQTARRDGEPSLVLLDAVPLAKPVARSKQ